MNLHRLRVIARKETLDHLTDQRFLLIAGLLLLIVSIGLVGGLITYKASIESYANAMRAIGEEVSYNGQDMGGSLLDVITSVGDQIMLLGAILGIAMGFDLITKEKEGGSLKLLLAQPIYRDEVINGKGLGGVVAIGSLVSVTFAIVVGILLAFGIVPDSYELFAIVVLAVISFLLIFSYFAMALLMSSMSRTGGTALIAALIVFIVLSSLLPIVVHPNVVGIFIGEPPHLPTPKILSPEEQMPLPASDGITPSAGSSAENGSTEIGVDIEESVRYEQQVRAYEEKRLALESVVSLLSPTLNFGQVMKKLSVPIAASEIVSTSSSTGVDENPAGSDPVPISVSHIFETLIPNLIALLVIPILFFGLSYARFMRLDVR
jgi:ABC-2 type transport system permease protein